MVSNADELLKTLISENDVGGAMFKMKLDPRVSGCLTQITASSYLGVFGSEVEDFTQRIIDAGLGFVFASDAHNLKGRNFRMQKAFAKLEQHNGAEMVTWMQDNAKKIIHGDDLEPSEYHHIKEKKKFWLFR